MIIHVHSPRQITWRALRHDVLHLMHVARRLWVPKKLFHFQISVDLIGWSPLLRRLRSWKVLRSVICIILFLSLPFHHNNVLLLFVQMDFRFNAGMKRVVFFHIYSYPWYWAALPCHHRRWISFWVGLLLRSGIILKVLIPWYLRFNFVHANILLLMLNRC